MTTPDRPRIGVLEAPDLALALNTLGFDVVGGGEFRAAALDIRSQPGFNAPIVTFDASKPGLRSWIDKQSLSSRIVVLRGDVPGSIPATTGTSITLPTDVNTVLANAGWGPSAHPLGSAIIDANGTIAGIAGYSNAAPQPEPEVVFEPAPVVEVAPAPAVEAAPAPTPVVEAPAAALPAWAVEDFGVPAATPAGVPAVADQFPAQAVDSFPAVPAPVFDTFPVAPGAPTADAFPAPAFDTFPAPAAPSVEPTPAAPIPSWLAEMGVGTPVATPPVQEVAPAPQPVFVPQPVDDSDESLYPVLNPADVPVDANAEFEQMFADATAGEGPSPIPVVAPVAPPAPVNNFPVTDMSFEEMVANAARAERGLPPVFAEPTFTAPPVAAEPVFTVPPVQQPVTPAIPDFAAPAAAPVPLPNFAQPEPVPAPAPTPAPAPLPEFAVPALPDWAAQPEPQAQPMFEQPAYQAPTPQPAPPAFETPVPAAAQPVFDPNTYVQPTAPYVAPTALTAPDTRTGGIPVFTTDPTAAPAPLPAFEVPHPTQEWAPQPPVPQAPVQSPGAPGTTHYVVDTPAFGYADDYEKPEPEKVIISFAGKGGVGKTSAAIAMAECAAAVGLRVALVDMNRGQGDVRTFLKMRDPNLPSIYNAAISGTIEDAVLSPDQINQVRPRDLPPLQFALVMAPPPELADPAVVTTAVYRRAIEFLTTKVDLVIVDTQIAEGFDTTGLIEGLVVPLLREGAHGLGVTDMSAAGLNNLLGRVKKFATYGVDKERMLLAVNKAQAFEAKDQHTVQQLFGAYATFAGAAGNDLDFANSMNLGIVDVASASLRPLINHVLFTVTGNPAFTAQPAKKRGGLFGRKK